MGYGTHYPVAAHVDHPTNPDQNHYLKPHTRELMSVRYQRGYYEFLSGAAPRSAAEIVPIVRDYVDPRSVVDVECGTGGWLAEFNRHGAQEIMGLDGPWVPKAQLLIPQDRFQVVELGEPIRLGRRFDLVVSLEVAEHLPAARAETFVGSLVGLGDVILFSAAIPYQGGENHLNEQWPDYWARLFGKGLSGIKYSVSTCLGWVNRVVPISVKAMALEA